MADIKSENNMLIKQSFVAKEGKVLIVGGGPAGLATAIMLAKRGWTNITVLEQRATADYYEPDKSFNYLIDGRGQKLTDLLGITHHLSQIGVSNQEFYLTRIEPNGSRKTSKLPIVDANRKTAYWVTRKAFVLMLYQEIAQNWQHYITVVFNTKCLEINKIVEEKLEIIAQDESGSLMKFKPDFLVGCDGIHSLVRNTLAEWDKSNLNKFEMQLFPSPSSGLRYKVLSLPPKVSLDRSGKEPTSNDMAYILPAASRDRLRNFRLGLLPIKNPDEPRTANLITLPDHHIWELKTGEALYNFFEEAFPQLLIREIISPEEAERFAKSEGGYFPKPQYCNGLQFLVNESGIILLGDTVHCFPPDIGQGVNSALEDVYVLNEALSQTDDNISQALPLYESWRSPDVKALIHLAQTAFPWQYNQAPFRTRLWSINFFIRLLLSRWLPQIFSPPAFFMIQNHQLSYQEIWSMAQRTSRILYVVGLISFISVSLWLYNLSERVTSQL